MTTKTTTKKKSTAKSKAASKPASKATNAARKSVAAKTKAATKKSAAKKPVAKKAAVKKTTTKKTAAKKPAAKKAATKTSAKAKTKTAVKKTAAKKGAPKAKATTAKVAKPKAAVKKPAPTKAKKAEAAPKPAAKAVAPKPAPRPAAKAEAPKPKIVAPPVAKPEFKKKEHVVYPAHGVGQITDIEDREVAGINMSLYVVTFEKDKMTLRVPIAKAKGVGMRRLSEPTIIKNALTTLRGRARIKRTMWSRRAQEYEAKINSGDLISIAEVVRDLHRGEGQPEQSYSERQLYEAAIDRMAREVAAADGINEDDAVKKLESVLHKDAA